jgi:deazaflavin-dependent oxidoreductase (nitroreductase family)
MRARPPGCRFPRTRGYAPAVAREPTYAEANRVQRGVRRFAASGPGAWLFVRVARHADARVYRLTKGRHTLSGLISGIPTVQLTTTGAKSGRPRTTTLLGLPTEGGIAVVASNFGQRRHPAWFHNLQANPACEVTVEGETRTCRAVEVTGERRERIWRQGLEMYPGWSQYESRTPHRRIAVFVLEPAGAPERTGEPAAPPERAT